MNNEIGRNEKCPCGSLLKYKNCYKEGSNCKLFKQDKDRKLLSTHPEKEKEIIDFLTEAIKEVKGTFYVLESGNSVVSTRVQLIVCFSLIDVFASYWQCYISETTTTQSERFDLWLNKFCFNQDNAKYDTKKFDQLNIQSFGNLRNSLVHFFALPNSKNPSYFLVPNNFEPEEKLVTIAKKLKNKNIYIQHLKPIWVRDWIINGAQIMFEEMLKNIELSKKDEYIAWQHITGISRIYDKTQLEGAKKLSFEEYFNLNFPN